MDVNKKTSGKKVKNLKEFSVSEFEDWVPQEAFKVAHDFRNKCAS
jgi:hypothetical protein